MPTRQQVLELVRAGRKYEQIAAQLCVPPGQAYMEIRMGMVGEAFHRGKAEKYMKGAEISTLAGALLTAAKRALDELRHLKPGTEDFARWLRSVAGMARAHISDEQSQVWPALSGCLSTDQVAAMAARWARYRSRAPARPHPHVPSNPSVLRFLGPLAAIGDRALAKLAHQTAGRA